VLYAPVCAGWLILSTIVGYTLPMIFSVVCTLILSWKIAGTLNDLVVVLSGSFRILIQLATLAVMVGIVTLAVARSGKTKEDLDHSVEDWLMDHGCGGRMDSDGEQTAEDRE